MQGVMGQVPPIWLKQCEKKQLDEHFKFLEYSTWVGHMKTEETQERFWITV